jgi:hypothetical protein
MTPARRLALAAIVVVLSAAAAFALLSNRRSAAELGPQPPAERPALMLLTSLPLMFGEDFSLKSAGSPVLIKLQSRYRVIPISVTSEPELAKAPLLMMAQPQAQTAENLVALDAWVRSGGRVLLFADPLLEWPSKRPLGDKLRPPPMFADTGLLEHWGLKLDPPRQLGLAKRQLAGFSVLTVSPGMLSGACEISSDGLVARCNIGNGIVMVVADGDLLNAKTLGPGARDNVDAVLAELSTLQR